MNQLTMFPTEPQQDCQPHTVIEDKMPFAGWKAGELSRYCGECWQYLDENGNAPALGE